MENQKNCSKRNRVDAYMSSENFKESNLFCKNDLTKAEKITNCDIINNRAGIVTEPRKATKTFKCLYEGGHVFYQ
jgi:hypothetical protein